MISPGLTSNKRQFTYHNKACTAPFSAAFVKYSAAFVRSTFPASPVVYIFPLKTTGNKDVTSLNVSCNEPNFLGCRQAYFPKTSFRSTSMQLVTFNKQLTIQNTLKIFTVKLSSTPQYSNQSDRQVDVYMNIISVLTNT